MEKLILECVVRSALIAVCTAAALFILRVKAARVRHTVWAGVVALMLMLPVWTAWGPRAVLRVLRPGPVLTEAQPQVVTEMSSDPDQPSPPVRSNAWTWQTWLTAGYLTGLFALLARLGIGTVRARMLVRKAAERDGRLTSDSCIAPITVGWLRPAVILPLRWTLWPQSQLSAVLAHEDEHARRRDPLVQWLALLNRAIFWFHPLAWWLERRLSALSEEACDDAVMMRGHDPVQYSECLLGLARLVRESGARVNAVGMAMPGVFLPQRIRRIVAGEPVQRISRGRMISVAAVCVAVSTVFTAGAIGYAAQNTEPAAAPPVSSAVSQETQPVSAMAPAPDSNAASTAVAPAPAPLLHWKPGWQGQKTQVIEGQVRSGGVLVAQVEKTIPGQPTDGFGAGFQTVSGTVADPSNAVVANAAITLTNTDTKTTRTVNTDNSGAYRFLQVDPGAYSVTVSAPGFKRLTQTDVHVAAGDAHNAGKMMLQLGSVSESVTVAGSRSAPIAAAKSIGNPLGPVTTLPTVGIPLDQASPAAAQGPNTFRFTTGRQADPATAGGPIRVGGNVQASKIVRQIKPVYPPELQQEGVQGTVRIEAVITKEGILSDTHVVSGNIDPRLAQLGLDSVKDWRYKPTLLNGESVETMTVIDVNFVLSN